MQYWVNVSCGQYSCLNRKVAAEIAITRHEWGCHSGNWTVHEEWVCVATKLIDALEVEVNLHTDTMWQLEVHIKIYMFLRINLRIFQFSKNFVIDFPKLSMGAWSSELCVLLLSLVVIQNWVLHNLLLAPLIVSRFLRFLFAQSHISDWTYLVET